MNKKKESIIILICAIVIIASIVAFFAIHAINNSNNSFIFNEHLEDTIITINFPKDTSERLNISSYNMPLKELSYYILVMEANVNHSAALYNPENLNSYWNLYISNTFVRTEAKNNTMEVCLRDNIYYYEALANGLDLNNEEKELVMQEAAYIYGNLTGKQVNATELTMETLYNVRYKIELACKYISKLMNESDYTEEELNIDGSYYMPLFESYDIEIDKLWNKIELGDITIDK